MRRRSSYAIWAIALSTNIIAMSARAEPIGLWRDSDGSITEIRSCGAALCGFLVSINPPRDPETGQPWKDKNNQDARKQNRPLVGVEVLHSMKPDGSKKWSGQLYNTDDGKTYSGTLIEVDAKTIRVEGCSGPLCGGENLSRVK